MPSIFPGMDPYLEAPWIWPDFHNSLADEIRRMLNQQLPNDYFAQLEARSELGIRAAKRIIAPDVAIIESGRKRGPSQEDRGGVSVAVEEETEVSTGIRVEFMDEPVTITSVAIRNTQTANEVVTLIEILSPANKRSGADRDHYVQRMREILTGSSTSLIEIDLLRNGQRTWERSDIIDDYLDDLGSPTDYLVMTSRSWSRSGADMHPISICERLPVIAVPLRQNEPVVPLSLQTAFNRAYDGGPYRRGAVDYSKPPYPPLDESQEQWRAALMLRGH